MIQSPFYFVTFVDFGKEVSKKKVTLDWIFSKWCNLVTKSLIFSNFVVISMPLKPSRGSWHFVETIWYQFLCKGFHQCHRKPGEIKVCIKLLIKLCWAKLYPPLYIDFYSDSTGFNGKDWQNWFLIGSDGTDTRNLDIL